MFTSRDGHAPAVERSCALVASALSEGRREGARLVSGDRRCFGLNEAGTIGICIRKAQDSFERLGIAGEVVRKELQSHVAAEANVLRFVNHSHPAAAQLFQDAVVADGFADHPRSTSLPGMVGWRAREVNETAGRQARSA